LPFVALIVAGLLALSAFALTAHTAPLGPATAVAASVSKGDPKDCSDFSTHRQAQRWFKKHHPRRDPAGLDADNDGKACEDLP
jgi:hypothetical protein